MHSTLGLMLTSKVVRTVIVLLCGLLAFPFFANAQNAQGQNAVYNPSGTTVGSSAFIDASMFGLSTSNICKVLKGILSSTSYPAVGTVIDARGLPGTTGTSMACTTANPSPWAGITNPPPSTILLPAGTIVIPNAWVLPNKTTLIE